MIRGFMIRLYPTPAQVETLTILEDDLRGCWNWLCKQQEEVLEATRCWAVKEGLVPDPGHRTRKGLPCFPPVDYNGMSPDQAEAAKKERDKIVATWHEELFTATKGKVALTWDIATDELRTAHDCGNDDLAAGIVWEALA